MHLDQSTLPGRIQETAPKYVNQAANHGDYDIATAAGSSSIPVIRLLGITIRSRGATTSDLTDIALYAGAGKVLTLIDSTAGAQANLDSLAKQVSWDGGQGGCLLATGEKVVATLTGTGATVVSLDVVIRYSIVDPGATLT